MRNKKYSKIYILIALVLTLFLTVLEAKRNPFRKRDPKTPEITIGWERSLKRITRTDWHYTEYPIFTTFNENFFFSHMLPQGPIAFRSYESSSVDGKHLMDLITGLLKEIRKKKKEYTDFIILRARNFNVRQKCGLLIVKFRNYPFVLKLFIETPKTFIDPYCKGFENQFFFYMSGGINRHVAGLMRIKNLELVQEQIALNETWKDLVTAPRKWFWLPKNPFWFDIRGKNIGGKAEIHTRMPGIYAIIADEIDTTDDAPGLSSQQRSELIMKLCMDLRLFVDPHSDNFTVKYNYLDGKYHITIVDTEHFPSIVGLKEEPFFTSHLEWGLYLSAKFFQDAFLQTKEDLRLAQTRISPCALQWN